MKIVRITAVCRADGLLDYMKDGTGELRTVLHPDQLEGQLIGNNVYSDERMEFQGAFRESGLATISFPPRHHRFAC